MVYGQKTTRTKDHLRRNFVVYVEVVYNELQINLGKVPVILASAQTDMFAAEYRSDNSSGLHCWLYQNVYSGTITPL